MSHAARAISVVERLGRGPLVRLAVQETNPPGELHRLHQAGDLNDRQVRKALGNLVKMRQQY